jgi:hypothetical protein
MPPLCGGKNVYSSYQEGQNSHSDLQFSMLGCYKAKCVLLQVSWLIISLPIKQLACHYLITFKTEACRIKNRNKQINLSP